MRKVALFYTTAKIFDTELNRRQLNSPICSIYNLYMCEMSHIMQSLKNSTVYSQKNESAKGKCYLQHCYENNFDLENPQKQSWEP